MSRALFTFLHKLTLDMNKLKKVVRPSSGPGSKAQALVLSSAKAKAMAQGKAKALAVGLGLPGLGGLKFG